MPEVFTEALDLRSEIALIHPEWLVAKPETRNWHRNVIDWRVGFWQRVRQNTGAMARIVSAVDEGALSRVPREWLRWAMREVQALRKVTPGTPVDNQICTYLVDYDIFLTSDRAFVDCIEVIRPQAPTALASTSVSPAGSGATDHAFELVARVSPR